MFVSIFVFFFRFSSVLFSPRSLPLRSVYVIVCLLCFWHDCPCVCVCVCVCVCLPTCVFFYVCLRIDVHAALVFVSVCGCVQFFLPHTPVSMPQTQTHMFWPASPTCVHPTTTSPRLCLVRVFFYFRSFVFSVCTRSFFYFRLFVFLFWIVNVRFSVFVRSFLCFRPFVFLLWPRERI